MCVVAKALIVPLDPEKWEQNGNKILSQTWDHNVGQIGLLSRRRESTNVPSIGKSEFHQ